MEMRERKIKMEKQIRGKKRLVLVTSPFQGHMTPMLQLGTALFSKGFSITIAHVDSTFNSPNPSTHPDFDFLPLSVDLSSLDPTVSMPEYLEALNGGCRQEFQKRLAEMAEKYNEPNDDHVVGIIYDNVMYFVENVANDLHLPRIILCFCNAAFMLAYNAIRQLHTQGNFPPQDSKLQELVPELYPVKYKDLPFINSTLESALEMVAIGERQTPPSAYIWNTTDYLEQSSLSKLRQHYQVPIFPIGPLHKLAPTPSSISLLKEADIDGIFKWLDKQAPRSVIYVSFGTIVKMDPKELAETAWGLANSKQPFLWVIRPSSVRGSEWIELLPEGFLDEMGEKCCIVKCAPQKEVLAHGSVGGFWSHCGWNSTWESICEGIPMMCRPFDYDQGVNARYLCDEWKIGVELENLERSEVEYAIKKLFVDSGGEKMRQRAFDMKEKALVALQQGGSSYNSLNDLVEFILSDCQMA